VGEIVAIDPDAGMRRLDAVSRVPVQAAAATALLAATVALESPVVRKGAIFRCGAIRHHFRERDIVR
jgi:hypothetical protein